MSLEETEINVGGVKFKGVYIAVVLGFVSTIGGTIWTASELYSRLEAVEAYEIPDTAPFHEEIQLIKQELEDNDVKSLQGKLAELGTNLKTIIEQQKELLAIKERVIQAEKDVEAMRTTVAEAKLIVGKVEGFENYLKQFETKIEKVDKEIDDIWLGMDELSNPLTVLIVQFAGIIWWASGVQASVERLEGLHSAVDHDRVEFYQRMSVVETKVEANKRILERLEEKIDGMQ